MIFASLSLESILEKHSNDLMILLLFAVTSVTLLIIVPQLLRAHHRKREMQHREIMSALEKGQPLPASDEPTKAAGRVATLVPIVAVISAGTVTCFVVVYKTESLFSVTLAVWAVAAVISLAAITGGVALIGRVAQLQSGEEGELPPNPLRS